MLGLRTHEGKKFEKFFSLVQKKAAEENSVFFLDFGAGEDTEIDNMIIDDMCGWLVPKSKAKLFEQLFLGKRPLDDWEDYIYWVIVDRDHQPINVTFQQY
ncbi:MAG: hypothetical protein Q4A67_02150 [Aerococcus sp.]|nr:hypothetical protein [Aerococcus sp.]